VTRKLFWDDPYQTTLTTTVSAVASGDVMLAETILYTLSGGQERDHGRIGGYVVEDARKEGRDIWYTLGPAHTLRSGEPVQVELDWARRYRLMRLHFAAEIVLVLAYRMFPGVEKVGAHIAEDRARIDFTWPESIAPALPTSTFSDEAGERRYWDVPGFARVPCGGTHLRRTSEVGALVLRRKNVGKHTERVLISLEDGDVGPPLTR
jgi:Ser-tRNA(Ala) deacylase AlaX